MLEFNQKLARKRRQRQLNDKYQTMFLNMWAVGCILMFARAYFAEPDYFGLDSTPTLRRLRQLEYQLPSTGSQLWSHQVRIIEGASSQLGKVEAVVGINSWMSAFFFSGILVLVAALT